MLDHRVSGCTRGPDRRPITDMLMVSIDFSEITPRNHPFGHAHHVSAAALTAIAGS
jgi:hypothetical protein